MKIHKAGHILLFKAFVLFAFINVLVYAFIPNIIVFRAVLIVSGADGVQGHTETLWRLLKRYRIPVFLFVNKMDQKGTDQEAVIDSKKSGTTLKSGGVLRCQMPGAGGYGNPLERDRALIVHDLEEGYITPESALRDYGLTEEDLAQIEVFGKT